MLFLISIYINMKMNMFNLRDSHNDNEFEDKPPQQVGDNTEFVPAAGTVRFAQRRYKKMKNATNVDDNGGNSHGVVQRHRRHPYQLKTTTTTNNKIKIKNSQLDYLLDPDAGWDVSPIVLEEFKLVLFTTPKIATTVWKQLARRMMHYDDWKTVSSSESVEQLPHHPAYNGLRYLYHYRTKMSYDMDRRGNGGRHAAHITTAISNVTTVDEILTSPSWTRAIFVRDPIERLVSGYLDKAASSSNDDDDDWYVKHHCCGFTKHIKSVTTSSSETITTTGSSSFVHRRLSPSSSEIMTEEEPDDEGTSSKKSASASIREMMQYEHRKRLAPGIPPGFELPPYCENLKKKNQVEEGEEIIRKSDNGNTTTTATTKGRIIPFDVFVLEFLPVCDDPHWRPQSQRLNRRQSRTKTTTTTKLTIKNKNKDPMDFLR
jgi:Sulfotransferase family